MLQNFCQFNSLVSLPLLFSVFFLISGCTMDTMDRGYNYQQQPDALFLEIFKLKQHIAELEAEKYEIEKQQKLNDQLTSELQLGLLKKHARINDLLIKNKQLVSEFVRFNVELKNKDSKVETVRLLAEAATIIETAKNKNSGGRAEKIILNAEQYLKESSDELAASNFEGASYLAYQAIDIVHTLQSNENNSSAEGNEEEVTFVLHLPMKVLQKSNVREKPNAKAPVIYVEDGGDLVNAVGFKGHWVKVEGDEYGTGWIHYSLLGGLIN